MAFMNARDQPRILGALLVAVVHGLRSIGRVHLDWGLPVHLRALMRQTIEPPSRGRPDHVERERVRPSTFVCGEWSGGHLAGHSVGKKSASTRRSAAPGADSPPDAGHRHSRVRPRRDQNGQGEQ
jgi:hypothetical protein